MGLNDRLGYLLLGMAIGFVLGRLTRLDRNVREIKKELDEVDQILKNDRSQNDRGAISMGNVVLALILMLSLYASVASQVASNKTNDTADSAAVTAHTLARLVVCNQETLGKTLEALNERTAFATDTARKNIALQESQHHFMSILLHQPPPSAHKSLVAAERFNADSQSYIVISKKSLQKILTNPIPSVEQFTSCIQKAE